MKLIVASLIAIAVVCLTFPIIPKGEPFIGTFENLTYIVVTVEESSNDR